MAAASTIGISGCAHDPVDVAIGCGKPPALVPMTQDQYDRTDEDVVTWAQNNINAAKDYARELCARIRRHDELLGG